MPQKSSGTTQILNPSISAPKVLSFTPNSHNQMERQFVLLESNSPFTGIPKRLNFAINREKFEFIDSRLTYGTIGGRFRKGENPFIEEAYQRLGLDHLLRIAGIEDDDLLKE